MTDEQQLGEMIPAWSSNLLTHANDLLPLTQDEQTVLQKAFASALGEVVNGRDRLKRRKYVMAHLSLVALPTCLLKHTLKFIGNLADILNVSLVNQCLRGLAFDVFCLLTFCLSFLSRCVQREGTCSTCICLGQRWKIECFKDKQCGALA